MKYKKLWTDMHSNLHHEQMEQLPKWFAQVEKIMDFWPVAYYPFYMKPTKPGLEVEARYEDKLVEMDWEALREFTEKTNKEGFPMFMGYEWQGTGNDGDHNVFFLKNDMQQLHPGTYQELVAAYRGTAAIGIPHHMAYQPGSRGKNWDTHDEVFSPFAEIYSSHGCSETDDGPLAMKRHAHMGPRTGKTTFERAIEKGYRIGIIASGDNHGVPAAFEHGSMCALARDNTKEAIWEAFINRRVYGVSQSRIEVDFSVNGACMGSEAESGKEAELMFHVKGTDAVDRVEILRDNILEAMVVHSGTWEEKEPSGVMRFKFRLEFGWGPDIRVYPNATKKIWNGALLVDGTLLGVEKCWNAFGQELISQREDGCDFSITTRQATSDGRWMGSANDATEGFIFEAEADADSQIHLKVDGRSYDFAVRDMLKSSSITALWDEVVELTKETWGDIPACRKDLWWHNAYKFKLGRACPEAGYMVDYQGKAKVEKNCCYRLRVWQKNNDAAWTSPVFLKTTGD